MNRILFVFVFAIACASGLRGQTSDDAAAAKLKSEAASKGFPLSADLTVKDNVSVEAVLLPPSATRGLFGRAVADRYAAIELIVSNHSHDAAMVIQSVFIDYSQWLLSGAIGETKDIGNTLTTYQATNKPNQIASTEYRIPRGQLLDAQPWTRRNWFIRSAEAAGTVAAGFVFPFKELGIAKGIASYNGNVLPALRYLFPDATVEQLNRISDLGFRVNTVVPKEASTIVVAFFPIDRFLTPGLKKLFMKSPAIFFVPPAAFLDPESRKKIEPFVKDMIDPQMLEKSLTGALKTQTENDAVRVLSRLSLNRVRVVVGGVMAVDIDTIAAAIESMDFDETDPAVLWVEPGEKTGVIHGRYLSSGQVSIAEAGKLGITDLAVIQDGSDDRALRFKFRVTKEIPAGSKLTFRVTKKDKNQKPIEGVAFEYAVKDHPLAAPKVDKVQRSGSALTITGDRFFSTTSNPLTVTLRPSAAPGLDPVPVQTFDRKVKEIKIDLASLNLKPACWTPEVSVGNMKALGATAFAQPPAPRIRSAKKGGTRVVVLGEQFVDLSPCGKPLTFQLVEDKDGAQPIAVGHLTLVSPTEASFDLPTQPAGAKWRVRVLVDGVEAANQAVE
jgi:hypothetical protein